jgi:hypothetical protein
MSVVTLVIGLVMILVVGIAIGLGQHQDARGISTIVHGADANGANGTSANGANGSNSNGANGVNTRGPNGINGNALANSGVSLN